MMTTKLAASLCCSICLVAPCAMAEGPKHTNRLARESSPYLLQHAHNPVDWYPWGDEAFEKAKREQKMIFLSVGYAACHWCHVMERESFEDPEIATSMNERFVCVKVDSEERPDVDQIYMQAIQIVSRGSGGWPMSVFLLPDGRPFWGGTYFPARTGDRGNATGFLSIIEQVDQGWKEKQDAVVQQAETLTNTIKESHRSEPPASIELTASLVSDVADALADQFDSDYGGFGFLSGQPDRPKFPEPSNLVFLIDRIRRPSVSEFSRESAERMLRITLDGMISGAMIDHLGGGFHRYSVDRRWQIPHFEKMLYDNGQLASIFSEVYADTKNYEYGNVVVGICDFVLRELRAPGGAFYSALDADSEGEEGKFYRWSQAELKSLEEIQGFADFADVYRLNGTPNFETDFYVPDPGKSLTAIGKQRNEFIGDLIIRLDPVRRQLLEIRGKRQRPLTDVKILTAWNGLMIAGLADAGRIMKRVGYTTAAAEAADFVLNNLRDENGRLLRSYAGGNANLNAYLNDYAFLASGLIALHRATGDQRWLEAASRVTDKQLELFWDERALGFFFTSNDHSALIVRSKNESDSAIPAGTSVSAENLLYLAGMTGNKTYKIRLQETLKSIAPTIQQQPASAPRAAAVLAAYVDQE